MDPALIDEVLTTTRSVRRRLDLTRPVEPEVLERCLEIAAQAPTASDRQRWHFVVITDPALRAGLAALYRRAFALYAGHQGAGEAWGHDATPVQRSAQYLADHLHAVPALVLFCYERRVERDACIAQATLYGSIFPAVWSFMLALRARGLGTVITTLHLRYEQEAAQLLALPPELTQAALLPVAYTLGREFRPARRRSIRACTHWNGWGRRRDDEGAGHG